MIMNERDLGGKESTGPTVVKRQICHVDRVYVGGRGQGVIESKGVRRGRERERGGWQRPVYHFRTTRGKREWKWIKLVSRRDHLCLHTDYIEK